MELAKTTIGWITYAKRPLTVDELEHAVTIAIGSSSFGESNITYMEQMTLFFCGLVVVDETTHHIKLVHYCTQKYFGGKGDAWLSEMGIFLMNSCLTYISYDEFEERTYESEASLEALLGFSTLRYSVKFLSKSSQGFHVCVLRIPL
jgi:hypothetical protein